MAVIYVASDQQGAGKTALCATLAHKLVQQGKKVAVFKPFASGGRDRASDCDASAYHKLLGQKAEGWPADRLASGVDGDVLNQVKDAFAKVSLGSDVAIVEGSNSLTAQEHRQLVEALDASAVIVVTYRRDLSTSDLSRWPALLGSRFAGFVINGLTCYLGHEARTILLPSLESQELPHFGIIPEDRRLLGVSVSQIAEHLDARFLVCEEFSDRLVENLMVGGLSLDPGDYTFSLRDRKAVIVRGDRPDVQMSALATSTACMIATRGVEPIEYVVYEAEQEEVPLMVVETDTLETMAALNTLQERARFDHPDKLSRFSELLDEHLDMPSLLARAGVK